MKRSTFACLAGLLGVAAVGNIAHADVLPPSVTEVLHQREQNLARVRFVWSSTLHDTTPPVPAAIQQKMRQSAQRTVAQMYRRSGSNDPKVMKTQDQKHLAGLEKIWQGGSVGASEGLEFDRDGVKTLASGEDKTSPGLVMKFRQLYEGNLGLIVNDATLTSSGQSVIPHDPVAWASQGESVRYPIPVTQGLNLLPEHFVLLAGFDPLAMYGTQWKLISTTPQAWVISTSAAIEGYGTSQIQMTLSRNHGGLPEEIQTRRGPGLKTFRVLAYQKYGGDWIPSKVQLTDDAPGITHMDQTWTLRTLQANNPVALAISSGRSVHDYRLLSKVTTWDVVERANSQQESDIVYYRWSGAFPSVDDLKKMYSNQHPGEATPDPNAKSSLIPTAGGLLCLISGVWMFKRRGSGPA